MKKILIFSQAMEIGGAERALLGLLESFDITKYEIDLFLMRHQGDLMDLIPSKVNLLPENKKYASLGIPLKSVIKNGYFGIALGRLNGKIKTSQYIKKHKVESGKAIADLYSHKYLVNHLPEISRETYDVAISFLAPHYFVDKNVKANKKIAWIHTDYLTLELDVESELEMWSKYDKIVSISNEVTNAFLKTFPSLEDKIVLIENILSKDFTDSQADLIDVVDEMKCGGTKLLSIGRFCEAKNFDNVPEIASIIKSKKIDFKWFIVGYGADEDLIRSKIAEFKMEDTVILLGKKENPYPYIKNCDIYVQPSRYEGKAVTVHEALILNKPVVIANYATAKSQVNDGFDGIIVPQDNQGCADGLVNVIQNIDLQKQLIKNMNSTNYSNESEIEKLYNLIEE